jgi:ribulose-bisphosphate carboxylase large chain
MAKKTTSVNAASCDWKTPSKPERCLSAANKSKIYRFKKDFRWSAVKTERYKQQDGGWADIARNVLIGNHEETAKFHLRYFEIAPGGFSSFERHNHEHVVICIRGKGNIVIGKKTHALNYLDTAYVSPDTPHQLQNPYNEPFGFFCIVNAKRDKPKLL